MLSLPEIEQALMKECANDPRTSMLLYGILEHVRESDAALKARDERIGRLEALLIRTGNIIIKDNNSDYKVFKQNVNKAIADAVKYGDTGMLSLICIENADKIIAEHGDNFFTQCSEAVINALSLSLNLDYQPIICDDNVIACLATRIDPEEVVLKLIDVLRNFNANEISIDQQNILLRLSFGTAAYDCHVNVDELLAQAEESLMQRINQKATNPLKQNSYYKTKMPIYECA